MNEHLGYQEAVVQASRRCRGDRGQTGLPANFRQTTPEIHGSLVCPLRVGIQPLRGVGNLNHSSATSSTPDVLVARIYRAPGGRGAYISTSRTDGQRLPALWREKGAYSPPPPLEVSLHVG